MVGSLMYKKTDPNRNRRGPGYYYHRGKGIWSKYTPSIDGNEWHKKTKNKKEKIINNDPHKADYNTSSKQISRKTSGPKLRGINKPRKGYF